MMFVLLPLTCVYYPVSRAAGTGCRSSPGCCRRPMCSRACAALLIDHVFRADLMIQALAPSMLLLFSAAIGAFLQLLLNSARRSRARWCRPANNPGSFQALLA